MSQSMNSLTEAKTALRIAESALEQALNKETELINAQQRRIAELAHEVRTPLNAVIGYAQIISQEVLGKIDNPDYKDHANTIHKAGLHLLGVCDTVLGEFLNDSEDGDIKFEKVDAERVISSVVNLFTWMSKERGVTLSYTMDKDFPLLRTNATRLNQIIINLVSNAIKYTPKGGHVKIEGRVDPEDGAMILVVQDNGIGMQKDDLLRVRQPFEQGKTTSPHGDDGVGLGLSIAARLVTELEGSLEISSEEGVGTIVTLTIPVAIKHTHGKKSKSKFKPFS